MRAGSLRFSPSLMVATAAALGLAAFALSAAQPGAAPAAAAAAPAAAKPKPGDAAPGFTLTVVTIWLVPIVRDEWGWGWAFAMLAPGPAAGIVAMSALRRLRPKLPYGVEDPAYLDRRSFGFGGHCFEHSTEVLFFPENDARRNVDLGPIDVLRVKALEETAGDQAIVLGCADQPVDPHIASYEPCKIAVIVLLAHR